jgi:phage tail-like protein
MRIAARPVAAEQEDNVMAQFVVNPNRHDPYKQFKFRVKWNGQVVAGVTQVSALRRSTEVIEHREGGDPSTSRRSPGRTKFEPITLARGLTHDTEFEAWANKVWQPGRDVSLADFRRDIVIELVNEAGQIVMAYKVYRCWPSEYVALPELDANGNAVAFEQLTLQNEGWERDTAVVEPKEPSY